MAALSPACLREQRRRTPYRYWTAEEESQVRSWVQDGRTLTEIALGLGRPRRAVREKLRRMGLRARKSSRGPCDCDYCPLAEACLRAVKRFQALPRAECEHAWPSKCQ